MQVVFETDSLAHASPAAVSRLGVVHMSAHCVDWQPLVLAWLQSRPIEQRVCFTALWCQYVGSLSCSNALNAADCAASVATASAEGKLFETLHAQLQGQDRCDESVLTRH